MDLSLKDSFREARRATRRHAKSFYFASHALPKNKRNAAYALYAFCRHVDDCVDRAAGDTKAEAMLIQARKWINESGISNDPIDSLTTVPWLPAFQETVRKWNISADVLHKLIDGMLMDRAPFVRMPDWAALEHYCYHVASVVGLAMLPILAGPNASQGMLAQLQQPAAALGTAMQLTNILRDVGEDWQRSRLYLPVDELNAAGLSEADIAAGCLDARWQKFLKRQIERARCFYAQADPGISALPRDGSQQTARLMRVLYAEILSRIEGNKGDVFTQRAHVPLGRKVALAIWPR